MTIEIEPHTSAERPDEVRRRLLLSGLAGGAAFAMSQNVQAQEKAPSAGPIKTGRGSQLTGKVAVVTGAARGIGRAIAVEMAANGADIAAIDICGFVSTASNAQPATQEDLEETARQVRGLGRQCTAIKADIRDIEALRKAADQVERAHGQGRHRGGGRSHSTLEAASGNGRRRLARCHRQQPQRHGEHDPGFCAENGGTEIWPHHRFVVDAGEARDKGREFLLRLEMGYPRIDEVRCHGIGAAWHYCERAHSRIGGNAADAVSEALQ